MDYGEALQEFNRRHDCEFITLNEYLCDEK